MRILHVITGLAIGGAEIMMLRTVEEFIRRGLECQVASVVGLGPIHAHLEAIGAPVVDLGGKSPSLAWLAVRRLRAILQSSPPDVLHAWMYHANVIAQFAALGRHVPVITSIHHSLDNEADASMVRRITRRVDALLSRRAEAVVFASERGMKQHIAAGYSAPNAVFLPNGFDTVRFAPDPERRVLQRRAIGLDESEFVIGSVSRFDPVKDHDTLLRAANHFFRAGGEARLLLVGRGVTRNNPRFASLLEKYELGDRCVVLGEQRDSAAVFSTMDVACLSSRSEGFPLTIGEAMASGLPCVATDVGDCAFLVGETGFLVPPGNPEAMASAWFQLQQLGPDGRAAMGDKARARIRERFSMDGYVSRLDELYRRAVES